MHRLLLTILTLGSLAQALAGDLKVLNLRCEFKVNPLGLNTPTPRFSWQAASSGRNIRQTAYRILVSDRPELLKKNIGNLWDSEKITSSASLLNSYKGKVLQPSQTYYWKVLIWDNRDSVSDWSEPAFFQVGLLRPADWKGAKWIAYNRIPDSLINILPTDGKKDKFNGNNVLPIFRKEFDVKKSLRKATVFIAGLGHFELSMNGKKVGDHFLDAGWTKYDKEALYLTFEVTSQLRKGTNAVGVMLGNGFYYIPPVKGRYRKLKVAFGYPKMICRILLEYQDGTSENIVSNTTWKTSKSPITFSSIYGGEDYDANLEQKGWDQPAFNDKQWKNSLLVTGPPVLRAQTAEPLKVFEIFKPVKVTSLSSNNHVYDLGQNASGIIELKVRGRKGDTVTIYPAELLKADGSVNQRPTGSPYYFQYILKGDSLETWCPRFSYYGFRYLQVKGGTPSQKDSPVKGTEIISLLGLHVRNAATDAGNFTSSNELFNKTNQLIKWAIKSNMASVFTDCPHREKLGWLEEVHLMGSSIRYNYDIASLGRKVIQDMKSSQLSNGLVPEIAPEYVKFEWGGNMFRDSPEWGANSIIWPWYMYKWYGDRQALTSALPMMQKYITYLGEKAEDNILYQGLSDWYDLGPKPPGVSQHTPKGVTGTAIYYYSLGILDSVACLLDKPEEALRYRILAQQVKDSFNKKFYNQSTYQYASGSQTANAMALFMKLVDPQDREAVLDNLINDIRERGNSLTAGDIGYRYVLRVLENEGRSDVIFDMNSRTDVPGYGYQLEKGATALTESWAALPTVSNNHLMLGHLMEWFYSGVAGIKAAPGAIAFNKIEIRPEPVGDLKSAAANYLSPYGSIKSEWKNTDGQFELLVEIPANTEASIYLPATENDQIYESAYDSPIQLLDVPDLKFSGISKGRACLKVGSGSYLFKVVRK